MLEKISSLRSLPTRMHDARKAPGTFVVCLLLARSLVPTSASASESRTIGTAELHSMMMDNAYRLEGGRKTPFTIIDARSKDAYAEAHVFSAVSVPEVDFQRCVDLLPKDRSALLVVYGDDAKIEATGRWVKKAAAAGYTNVVVYSEGFPVWKERHMPVAPLRSGT